MSKEIKITGIKKAVGEYREANSHGYYSPWYGRIMLDREDGCVWTDTFYSLGHNEWNEYHEESVIDLESWLGEREIPVKMATVREWAEKLCAEWAEGKDND